MDAITPKAKHDTVDTHSHVVRPADLEWKKTRFPGCEVKGLLLDKETGLVTALMRFAPGAVLPDHEHVRIEQTYVLEGKLCDKEGPAQGLSVGPGEFVWREAGSRHVAWTPEGGLMLAMFQVPNKFYEKDGRVTDVSGADWDSLWGQSRCRQASTDPGRTGQAAGTRQRLPIGHEENSGEERGFRSVGGRSAESRQRDQKDPVTKRRSRNLVLPANS
jgi:quercetin dioxygenase-like cupin family protein